MDNKRKTWHISNTEIYCNKCKKNYIATKNDISTKNPNYYYKTCCDCRDKMQKYIANNKHLHYSKYQPSLFQ